MWPCAHVSRDWVLSGVERLAGTPVQTWDSGAWLASGGLGGIPLGPGIGPWSEACYRPAQLP